MKRKTQRLYFIIFVLACFGLAAGLALYALRDNLSYFYTPAQALLEKPQHVFRLGGMVKKGSLKKRAADLRIKFTVTDFEKDIAVEYTGILPDLFREGQGVVAKGSLDDKNVFQASELLAKHDEKYMPPELAKGLKKTK